MAQNNDPTKDPSLPSAAYMKMAPKWAMIETILGGTSAMREAGQDFLPKHSAESDPDYSERLSQAVLYNVTELTLTSLVGRVFREEMKLNEDVPEAIKTLGPNIDLQGTTISSFCTLWFREALAKGFAHCYIDMPALTEADRAVRTLADDTADNRRPFWSLVKPENMIFAHYETVAGVDTLLHARIVEFSTEMVGFAEVVKTQIRVLTPGRWEVWENINENKKNRKAEWVKANSGEIDLPIIPLVTFYTNKEAPMVAKPPLEDLVFLNIRHWQSDSDQTNVLTVARFPMLASSGAQQEAGKNAQAIGPRKLLTMRDPHGRFYYVEHSGKAIAAGAQDLASIEDRMSAYGAEFLRRQISGRTAFERATDTGEAISLLKQMAIEFEHTVEEALKVTGQWLDIKAAEVGTVTVNKEFTEQDSVDPSALNALEKARVRADVSRRTWLIEMKRRGIVDPTMNVDDEIKEIEREMAEGPHPPTFFAGQEQIQGTPASPATIADVSAGGDGEPGNPKTKTPAKKPATKTAA